MIYLNLIGTGFHQENMISNYKFYVKKLSDIAIYTHLFNDKLSLPESKDELYPSYPSLIPSGDGYLMNLRYVNYLIEAAGNYKYKYPVLITNQSIILNYNLQPQSRHSYNCSRIVNNPHQRGIDELKLYTDQEKIMYLGVCVDGSQDKQLVTGEYNLNEPQLLGTLMGKHKHPDVFCYPHDTQINLCFQLSPQVTRSLTDLTDTIQHDPTMPQFVKYLGCVANGYIFQHKLWLIGYLKENSKPPNYYHCLIILDNQTLKYKRHSILFKFTDIPYELCTCIIVEENRIICGYSKYNREVCLSIYNRSVMEHCLFSNTWT